MGTWGTGISSNDTYGDIYDDFMDMYNEGADVLEITARLIRKNQETINLAEDAPNFWFALANAQWECCALEDTVLKKVEDLIVSGEDLRIWKELDATNADIKARAKVLDKFFEKISVPKAKPKKRVKKKFYDSIFKKGDCLTYIMDNGRYGGAVVLTDETNTVAGVNYIAITTMDMAKKPNLSDFLKSYVHVERRNEVALINNKIERSWKESPVIGGFSALAHKLTKIDIEVIGQIDIYNPYVVQYQSGYPWTRLKSTIPYKDKYIESNGAPKSIVKLSDVIGKPSWLKKFFGK